MSTLLEALRRIETRSSPVPEPPATVSGASPPTPDSATPSSPRETPTPSPPDAALPSLPDAARPPAEDEAPIVALDAQRKPVASAGMPRDASIALGASDASATPDGRLVSDRLARGGSAVALATVEAVATRADRRVARQMLEQLDRRRLDQIGNRAVVLWMPIEPVPGLDDSARRVAAALGDALGAEVAVWSSAHDSAGTDDQGHASDRRRSAPGARADRPSPVELRRSHRLALVVGGPAERRPIDPAIAEYDGVYLIVELGATTRRAAADVAAQVRAAGGRLLGCVAVRPAEGESPQGTAR